MSISKQVRNKGLLEVTKYLQLVDFGRYLIGEPPNVSLESNLKYFNLRKQIQ